MELVIIPYFLCNSNFQTVDAEHIFLSGYIVNMNFVVSQYNLLHINEEIYDKKKRTKIAVGGI